MKKILLILGLVILSGCNIQNKETEVPEKNISNKYVQEQISILQKQIESGEITEDEAQDRLKQTLYDNQKINDGSTESILKKFREISPETADLLEKKIRENHPEEFED